MLSIEKIENLEVYTSQLELLRRLSTQLSYPDRLTVNSLVSVVSKSMQKILTETLKGLTLDLDAYSSIPPLSSNINFRIQLARENLGLSEADLARQLNTYSDYILFWERGDTELPADMVIPLASALKCDPLWLLTGESSIRQASEYNVEQQRRHASQQADVESREVLQQ